MEQAEDPLVRRLLNRMSIESDRMIKLVDDVLLVSKMDTKGETTNPEVVDLIELVENLIQQFYRGDNVKNIVGTGLGLYVVKRFADLNHIKVEVRSKLKQGTTFTLTFQEE